MALGTITRVAPQDVEALVEPREQRARRKEARAGRRELDRQRHPIETLADTRDRRARQPRGGAYAPCAISPGSPRKSVT